MGRKTRLTPDIQKDIVDRVRIGAYPWVAAQSCGIPPSTFYRWMASGEKDSQSRYREFWEMVTAAAAYARMLAEGEVRKEDPFKWLRYGPGRERPGEPGWTDSTQVDVEVGAKLEQVIREIIIERPKDEPVAD